MAELRQLEIQLKSESGRAILHLFLNSDSTVSLRTDNHEIKKGIGRDFVVLSKKELIRQLKRVW